MANSRRPARKGAKVHSFIDAQTRQAREARRHRIATMLNVPLDHPEVTRRVEESAQWDSPLAVINGEITAKWLRSIAALVDEEDPRFRFVTFEANEKRVRGRGAQPRASPELQEQIKHRTAAGRKVMLAKKYLLEAAEVMWASPKRRKK
jgi:hypothetical protein